MPQTSSRSKGATIRSGRRASGRNASPSIRLGNRVAPQPGTRHSGYVVVNRYDGKGHVTTPKGCQRRRVSPTPRLAAALSAHEHLAMRGAPARAIQEFAGHQDLATTQGYMHLSPAAVDSAIRLLAGDGAFECVDQQWRRRVF